MAASNVQEIIPLIPKPGIPDRVRDNRWPYQKKLAVYCILASTLFERIAFYSLMANIVLILKSPKFAWNPSDSATAVHIFSGTSYVSTILFAAISDAKLGRAKTIILGFIPYLIGYIMIILILYDTTAETLCLSAGTSSHSIFHQNCAGSILATLVCTAIGAGAVQANMAVFGAEQSQKSKITVRYFDKYVIAVNIGGVIATLVIPFIGKETGHHYIGAIVAAAMLVLATILFVIGCRYYIHVKPYDTVITVCIPVVVNACQSLYRYKTNRRSMGRLNSTSMDVMTASGTPIRKEEPTRIDEPSLTFLDFAKIPNHGKFLDRVVDNVKSVSGALAMCIILIPYWLIYDQLDVTFPLQGQQMYTPNGKYMITLMSLGDPITIIIGIFILDMFVYKRLNNENVENAAMILTDKFVIGMCFASMTMCITGIVESFRQDQCDHTLSINESHLNIFYQLPQIIFMGLSELFATVASYKYAYLAAPRSAQSLFMSLRFCSAGISSIIGSVYINVFPTSGVDIDFKCLSDKDWQWSFYAYFYILAAVQLVFIFILILCQKMFQIIKLNPEKMDDHRFL